MRPARWDEHRLDVERGLFVRHRAAPNAPHLVWLHGLGESGTCFETVIGVPPLDRYSHTVFDLPGYGRTPWPARAPSIDDAAATVAAWLTAATGPVTLIGHSLGGVIAMRAASRVPERVTHVLDVEGNKSLGDCTFSGQAADIELDEFVGPRFEALLEHTYVAGVAEPALRGYYASLRLCDRRVFHHQANELVVLSRAAHLAEELAALGVPHTYIAGAPGGACKRSHELLAAAGVPVVSLEPAGHWPFIDQPRAFARAVHEICHAPAATQH